MLVFLLLLFLLLFLLCGFVFFAFVFCSCFLFDFFRHVYDFQDSQS